MKVFPDIGCPACQTSSSLIVFRLHLPQGPHKRDYIVLPLGNAS